MNRYEVGYKYSGGLCTIFRQVTAEDSDMAVIRMQEQCTGEIEVLSVELLG